MSAIGDYVHSSAYGYHVYGTNYPGTEIQSEEQKKAALQDSYDNAKNKILKDKSSLTPKEKEDLQGKIEAFTINQGGENKESIQKMWSLIEKGMEKQLGTFADDIVKQTGNVIKDNSIYIPYIRTKTNQENILTSTLVRRINAINSFIQSIPKSNTKEKLQETMQELSREINSLAELNINTMKNTDIPQLISQADYQNRKIKLTSKTRGIIDSLNEVIRSIRNSANYQKGMLGQILVAVAPYVGADFSQQEIMKVITETVEENTSPVRFKIGQGGISGEVKLETVTKPIVKKRGKQAAQKMNYQLKDGYWECKNPSPDKVDVTLHLQDKELPISVKNVSSNLENSSPWITLVRQSNLLALLQYIGPDFTNHYLNIVSGHRYGQKVHGDYEKEGNSIKGIRSDLLRAAKQAIRLNLLIAAFQGYKENAEGGLAEIFVIINNTTGKVTVYNVQQLVAKALENENYLSNQAYVKIQAGQIPIENVRFDNAYVKGKRNREYAFSRVSNLLHEVWGKSVTVAIKKQNMISF